MTSQLFKGLRENQALVLLSVMMALSLNSVLCARKFCVFGLRTPRLLSLAPPLLRKAMLACVEAALLAAERKVSLMLEVLADVGTLLTTFEHEERLRFEQMKAGVTMKRVKLPRPSLPCRIAIVPEHTRLQFETCMHDSIEPRGNSGGGGVSDCCESMELCPVEQATTEQQRRQGVERALCHLASAIARINESAVSSRANLFANRKERYDRVHNKITMTC